MVGRRCGGGASGPKTWGGRDPDWESGASGPQSVLVGGCVNIRPISQDEHCLLQLNTKRYTQITCELSTTNVVRSGRGLEAGPQDNGVTAMDSYEDMFKEITRKLYGEDGLPDLASGEKLTGITTSAERGLTGIDYDVEPPVFKPEEHITAFGLAALMQNGFPPAGILNPNFQQPKSNSVAEDKWISNDDYLQWTQSKIASYNPSQKLFRCADCDCVGFLARVAEHWLGTHANLRVFQCPQCPYASAWARCVRMHLVRQHNVNSEDTVDAFLKENPVFHEITRPQTSKSSTNMKSNSSGKSSSKKKGEKRYSCCYCSWSGVDNWCLKRHLNTHLKPFVCGLCDYKAARSERLATHVLKVHNKRACGRCLFLADDQAQLAAHQQEHHPLEQRNNRSSNNVLRNNSFNTTNNQTNQTFGHGQSLNSNLKPYELSAAAAILQHGSRLLPMAGSIISNNDSKPWKPYTPKQHGAARLFNYMEASDGSEPECDTTTSNDEISRMTTPSTTQRNQSDFPEAGDVGNHHQGELEDEYEEEMELPLFICRECGCEFVDDTSLETHQFTHHRVEKITTSPANQKTNRKLVKKSAAKTNSQTLDKLNLDSKENVNPKSTNYNCTICKLAFTNQVSIMSHMRSHITLNHNVDEQNSNGKKQFLLCNQRKNECASETGVGNDGNGNSGYCYQDGQSVNGTCKRSRKQSQPRKVVPPVSENPEIQVKKRSSFKHRVWHGDSNKNALTKLKDKYMSKLIAKKGLTCNLCKRRKLTFHTKGSLALHYVWRHMHNKAFECEHCGLKFHHRYQVVLHASEVHVNSPSVSSKVGTINETENNTKLCSNMDTGTVLLTSASLGITEEHISAENSMNGTTDKQLVPTNKLQPLEPILRNVTVLAAASDNSQTTDALLTTNVPDNSLSNLSIDKLNMHPFMEHSMLNPNIPVNNHIPIVIPTFPPS
ncbi:charlatan [Carabus blaptoides fortunei]